MRLFWPLMDPLTLHLSVLKLLHIAVWVKSLLVVVLGPEVCSSLPLVKLEIGSNLKSCVAGGDG